MKKIEHYGFCKVATAIPAVKVADCQFNVQQIKELILKANEQAVQMICFPELSVTGSTCGDLLLQELLIRTVEKEIANLLEDTEDLPITFIIGAPVKVNAKLYNCALVCQAGEIKGIVPKSASLKVPVTEIFYANDATVFGSNLLFGNFEWTFAVEIGEDVCSVIPPSSYHALNGAQLIFNLSAMNELVGKHQYIKELLSQHSARCLTAYVYSGAGFGESTTDWAFAGNAFIYENGKLLSESERFQIKEQLIINEIDFDLLDAERMRNPAFLAKPTASNYRSVIFELENNKEIPKLKRSINPNPFIPNAEIYNERCEEIFSIQMAGLLKRMVHLNTQSLLIGVSGGLDSTLALLVCVKAIDKLALPRKTICGVTMPGFGTTDRTYNNALNLMKSLGIEIKEISIVAACEQHLKDINHDPNLHDAVYENVQSRERTQILMNLANQKNGIVIGTGDMSELALGWTTYNGDHISMYNVNASIPKTLVRHLVRWAAETQMDEESRVVLLDIADTPISPELLPLDSAGKTTQLTEEIVGSYELHDFFLYYTLRYGFTPAKILYLAQQAFADVYSREVILQCLETFFRRFISQQFKRNCMPDGVKVGSVGLSPRGDWKMPSDAAVSLWLNEIFNIKTTQF
jgi:NAD+ synthase (glutamine-hydrolysing)